MTYNEKRLRTLKNLFIITINRIEDRGSSKRVYFKFRKWHPIILILLIWKVSRYIIESSYDFIKELVDELNEEDFIEIEEDKQ